MSYKEWSRKVEGKPPVEKKKKNVYDDSTVLQSEIIKLNDGSLVEAELWSESGFTYLTYKFKNEDLIASSDEAIMQYLSEQGINVKSGKYPQTIMRKDKQIILTLTLGERDD